MTFPENGWHFRGCLTDIHYSISEPVYINCSSFGRGTFHSSVKRIMLDYLSMGGKIITFGISFYVIVEFIADNA